MHDYSRFKPVFNHTVDTAAVSADGSQYVDPRATTHFTIGGAGNPEMPQPPRSKCHTWDVNDDGSSKCSRVDWSPWVVCESGYFPQCPNFNYGRCTVHNATHLEWEQVSVTRPGHAVNGTVVQNASIVPGSVIDHVMIVQRHHGSFSRATDDGKQGPTPHDP